MGTATTAVGIAPKLSDAELVCLAVIQALLGYTSEARFVRYATTHLKPWFPYLPQTPGYNNWLRSAAGAIRHVIAALARACPLFHDDVWLLDSTPVECGRSRETVKRSDLAGWAGYGYSASHSRCFWGLRLHLIATPTGLLVAFALTGAKDDERDIAAEMISIDPDLHRPGQTLIADKGYRSATFEAMLTDAGITLIRPTITGEQPRPYQRFSDRSVRSSNQSTKPSKPNSTSNDTADANPSASPPASCNDSSPSPPPSGTTKPPTSPDPHAHSSHTTTDPLELII